jgi:hypothetical protein
MGDVETAILCFIEQYVFAGEIDALTKGHSHVKNSSYIRKLYPVIDNDRVRVVGQLHESSMPTKSKHPENDENQLGSDVAGLICASPLLLIERRELNA